MKGWDPDMKRGTMITAAAALLSALLLASCGESAAKPAQDTESKSKGADAASTEAVTEDSNVLPYNYELADYGGYEFHFLNEDETDWANCNIAPKETNGEIINDVLYNRASAVEDALNIDLIEDKIVGDYLLETTQKLVTAGENTYDAVSIRVHELAELMMNGMLRDLNEFDTLHLSEPWWDQIVIQNSKINDRLFFVSSDISLFPFEATWVMYFNETLFSRLDIEYPYQLVRDGKWTIDALNEIIKTGVVINEKKYNPLGTNIYGLLAHSQVMGALLTGSGEMTITYDKDGTPEINPFSDRFYSMCEKIGAITAVNGQYIDRDQNPLLDYSISKEFLLGSFLTSSDTLGHIGNLRVMEDNFGVVPMPKYDEAQESYHSMIATWGTLMTTVPATNVEDERTGRVLDYLAYQSHISLMEPYYESYLTQKGVRNEDSAEMLAIVRDTRTLNVGQVYGWSTDLEMAVWDRLTRGGKGLSSLVPKHAGKIQAKIDKTIEAMMDVE